MTARRFRQAATLALMVGLTSVGCASGGVPAASPGDTATPTAPTLPGTRWMADEVAGKPVISGSVPTASFGADGALTGTGGCNRFTTRYTTTGTSIHVDEVIATTMMACGQEVMAQETAFLGSLTAARTFAIAQDRLTLSDEAGAVVARLTVQAQSPAGTWTILGYHDGASSVVSPVTGSAPAMTFADGTVSGSAGCNQFTGPYHVDGESLSIGPASLTRMACAEPEGVMAQESALLRALESAATFTLDGDRLTIRRADGATAITATRR